MTDRSFPRRRPCSVLVMLMLGVVLASAWHPAAVNAKEPRGVLTLALATFANETFLPDSTPGAEMVFSNYMFEHLVRRDPKSGENRPMLATSWETRDRGATWVFKLRRGVQFHDNFGELTCEDVKATFAKASRPGTANTTPFLKKLQEVQCPDPYTAVVKLSAPHPMMPNEVNAHRGELGNGAGFDSCRLALLDEVHAHRWTSSSDAQVLNLLKDIQQRLGLTYYVISHDLATMRYISTRLNVMYGGRIVEHGESQEIYSNPLHPYSQALLSAALPLHPSFRRRRIVLSGEVPSPLDPPAGCRFHPRCPLRMAVCSEREPLLKAAAPGRLVACHAVNAPD